MLFRALHTPAQQNRPILPLPDHDVYALEIQPPLDALRKWTLLHRRSLRSLLRSAWRAGIAYAVRGTCCATLVPASQSLALGVQMAHNLRPQLCWQAVHGVPAGMKG